MLFLVQCARLEVLGDKPGLKGGVEQGGGDAAEQPPDQQDVEIVVVLGEAADGVRRDIQDARLFAAPVKVQHTLRNRFHPLQAVGSSEGCQSPG